MKIDIPDVERIVGANLTSAQKANAKSALTTLNRYGASVGLDQPHRVAQYLAQLLHEGGAFRYDRELASGAAYEGRKKLGNTKPGDGKRFKGRGPIQITGRKNYRAFTQWAKKLDPSAPNFEATPDAINTDPWEGLGPLWYWSTHDLNRYADAGNIEMITREINGGTNGLDDRIRWYVRTALVLLGYGPNDLKAFQQFAKVVQDGIAGPVTRAALHKALVAETSHAMRSAAIMAAPVVEQKPVVPHSVDKKVKEKTNRFGFLAGGVGVASTGFTWLDGADWEKIIAVAGVGVLGVVLFLLLQNQLISAIKNVREGLQ